MGIRTGSERGGIGEEMRWGDEAEGLGEME